MARMTGGVKTGRYYIRLPEETITEIDGYIKESGMYQAHFLSNALIVGARQIAPRSLKSSIQAANAGEYGAGC
jgi:hypothetical protein